jgi:hypothetical protein
MCEKKGIVFGRRGATVQWTNRCKNPEPCKLTGERAQINWQDLKECCSPKCCSDEVVQAIERSMGLITRDSEAAVNAKFVDQDATEYETRLWMAADGWKDRIAALGAHAGCAKAAIEAFEANRFRRSSISVSSSKVSQ